MFVFKIYQLALLTVLLILSASGSLMSACHTRLVVIGGGLSGTSAALQASQTWSEVESSLQDCTFEVVILDKESRLGGNSMKASSGINAVLTENKSDLDSFIEDTRQSGGGLSNDLLIKTLVYDSKPAIEFLQSHGVDLSGVTRLGGHSMSRTRYNPAGANVGLAIMKQLLAAVEKDPLIKVITSAEVTSIEPKDSMSQFAQQYTVRFSKTQSPEIKILHELTAESIVIATGGFGANKTLLEKYAKEASVYATTNGPWSTGDGLVLGDKLGAKLVQLEEVQVHPTGFVDPKEPDSGSKILAAEKLRGCGAIMLSMQGHRFVDELNRRDHVFSQLSKQEGEKAWLVLSEEGGELFNETHMGFYKSRGLITKFQTLKDASDHMKITEETLSGELDLYNKACKTGKDEFGKKTFPSSFNLDGPVFISIVTPVVHYTMGGLQFNEHGQVLGSKKSSGIKGWMESGTGPSPIRGIYAAGEVTGGLHGKNRLGGNSLLDCVVFGRRSGTHATQFISQRLAEKEL